MQSSSPRVSFYKSIRHCFEGLHIDFLLANASICPAGFSPLSEIQSASQLLSCRILSATWLEYTTRILHPQPIVLPVFQRKDVSKSGCRASSVTLMWALHTKDD